MQFGCKESKYDSRDYKLKSDILSSSNLPEEFILPINTCVKNQKHVSSCVACATSSILEYHSNPNQTLSTNFIYGIRKKLFNSKTEGMSLRDACKIVADYGDMLEEDCPGNNEVPRCCTVAEESMSDPDKVSRASEYRVSEYFLCKTNDDIKYAIYKYGPVLGAIKWYKTYKVDSQGIIYGSRTGKSFGHAIMIYGYNKYGFLCQNSWGEDWGVSGRFILPYDIEIQEARGLVDWDGESELKKPNNGLLWNVIYKTLNGIANILYKILRKTS